MKDVEDDKKGNANRSTTHRKVHIVAGEASPRKPSSSDKSKGPLETEILTVHVERDGQQVSAKWGLNPRLKEELTPEEWKEVTDIMGKVTDIVGKRFSEMLAQGPMETGGNA